MQLCELKEMIEDAIKDYGEDMEVAFKPTHSYYVENISYDYEKDLVESFRDKNFNAVIIHGTHQLGGI